MKPLHHTVARSGAMAVVALAMAACSGLLPSLAPGGYVVAPEHLGRFTGGGSLSTLWYHGSDGSYHYFSHLAKVSTRYRVKCGELHLDPAEVFPRGSKQPVYASRMVERALKQREPQR